jgi:endogenous inhibitor of DNA gyrase (YacG/DUF329 family)
VGLTLVSLRRQPGLLLALGYHIEIAKCGEVRLASKIVSSHRDSPSLRTDDAFCTTCGRPVEEEEAIADTRTHSNLEGNSVTSWTEFTHYCPECAKRRMSVYYWTFGAVLLVVLGIAALSLI